MVSAGPAGAQQAFPNKPIRIIIPFSPGGTNDILARLLAPKLTEALGQPVIVDNRPGGNTVIASEALLKSPPDGHTLLLPGNSHVLVPYLTKAPLPFDSINDFAPVATLARTGLFLVVTPRCRPAICRSSSRSQSRSPESSTARRRAGPSTSWRRRCSTSWPG